MEEKRCFIFVSFGKTIFNIKEWNTDLKNGTNMFMEYCGRIFEIITIQRNPFILVSILWIVNYGHYGCILEILWSHFGRKFLKDLGDIKSMNSGKDMKELFITDKMSCTK